MTDTHPAGALPAKQNRSQETARRIVDAMEALLREKSFDQLTMTEIARHAGLTPGAIYRRFENKDALLPHIFDRYRAILGEWLRRVSAEKVIAKTKSLAEAVELVIRETLAAFKNNAHIFRTVHLYGRLHPEWRPDLADPAANRGFAPLDAIVDHFSMETPSLRREDVNFIGHVIISSIGERTLYPENLPAAALRMSDRRFVLSLSQMIVAWLRRTEN